MTRHVGKLQTEQAAPDLSGRVDRDLAALRRLGAELEATSSAVNVDDAERLVTQKDFPNPGPPGGRP